MEAGSDRRATAEQRVAEAHFRREPVQREISTFGRCLQDRQRMTASQSHPLHWLAECDVGASLPPMPTSKSIQRQAACSVVPPVGRQAARVRPTLSMLSTVLPRTVG